MPTALKILVHEFFFVRLLVVEIWSILCMGNFAYILVGGIHQNRPYTKSTISQKLKVAQKKIHELKNDFQSNAHISCKFDNFEQLFF